MSSARLLLRHVTVSEAVDPSQFGGGSVFVASDDPPPVRTVLRLVDGDADPRAVEVTKVIEVPESNEGVRGFYVQEVDAEKLELHGKVGTEHLESGETPALQEASGMQFGAPAPVMDPDDSIQIDNRERERLEEESDSASESDDRSGPADAGTSGSESDGGGQSVTSDDTGGQTSGEIGGGSDKPEPTSRKRRRGRKKR
jgi:hypothetical protein